jgi:hypothetical protein
MPEPTEENPVPTLQQVSNKTLKRMIGDPDLKFSLGFGGLQGFREDS